MLSRDGHACVARGVLPGACRGPLDAGHIVGRGSGGTPEGDRYDRVEWLVTHCRRHNGAIEDSAEVRRAAIAAGQHIARIKVALIPERALVLYPDGRSYYLNPDGSKEEMTGW